MLNTIIDIDDIQVLPAQVRGPLSVLPLVCDKTAEGDYITLDEALSERLVEITEVSEGGSVPELLLRNRGDRPVLLLDGEELVGAKQNRVLNLTVLAPASNEITIPVSCVEQGRWSWRSRDFASADRTLYAAARRSKMQTVSESLRTSGTRRSDQAGLWDDISAKSERLHAFSETWAASAMFEQSTTMLNDFVETIEPLPGQVGAVFVVHGQMSGVELFGSARVLRKLLPKLLRSYGLDAVDTAWHAPAAAHAAATDGRTILAELLGASLETHKALGLGDDVRLETPGMIGAALINDGRLVHLSAFGRSPAT